VLSAAALAGATVLALTAALILGCWWLVRTGRAGFESVLLVAGVGLLLSMEVVFARVAPWPSGPARWNTSLKVAVQGWTLAAVGAGGVAAIVLSDARAALASVRAPVSEGQSTATDGGAGANGALLAGTLVVAVVLASSVFPAMAAGVELGSAVTDGERFTLDGLAAHEQERPEELAALRWLEKRDGRPTVVEAPGRAYQWTSIAATTTGLPGVVGWTHHQENYRPDDRVAVRVAAVERIYTGEWSRAAATLAEYDVAYVYVGPVARERYGDALRSFAGRPGLSVAYETDAVTIYRVDQNRLDG
jgi:uncharacterized membrane protein